MYHENSNEILLLFLFCTGISHFYNFFLYSGLSFCKMIFLSRREKKISYNLLVLISTLAKKKTNSAHGHAREIHTRVRTQNQDI